MLRIVIVASCALAVLSLLPVELRAAQVIYKVGRPESFESDNEISGEAHSDSTGVGSSPSSETQNKVAILPQSTQQQNVKADKTTAYKPIVYWHGMGNSIFKNL